MIDARLYSELLIMKEQGDMTPFYARDVWKRKAKEVRRFDLNECQLCKARGRYSRGYIVHHIKHLEDRPDLALSTFDEATGDRQLITLCKSCHEAQHPDALRTDTVSKPTVTVERWD